MSVRWEHVCQDVACLDGVSVEPGGSIVDARYYRVSGKVQGVFYRASAQARARELGLDGWVRR